MNMSLSEDKDIMLLTKLKEKNPSYCLTPALTKSLKKKLDQELEQEKVITLCILKIFLFINYSFCIFKRNIAKINYEGV